MLDLAPLLLVLMLAGPAVAGIEEGYDAFERGDVAAAVAIWRGLAEHGNATAQFNLGQLYRLGQGVPANDQEALKWYLLAAEGGKVTAKHNLILMYEEGRITRADIAPLFATSNEGLGRMPPDDFLVQVIATSSRASLDEYLQTHQSAIEQLPVQVVSIHSKGRDLYLLLLGPFSELDHAQTAKSALPPAVSKEGAWIRKVSAVQAVAD